MPRNGRSRANAERDAEVCRLRSAGLTLQEIADEMHLSRERVRQIVERAGGPTRLDVSRQRAERVEQERHCDRERVIADVAAHPGTTASEVADRLGLTASRVRSVAPAEVRRLLVSRSAHRSQVAQKWGEEEILDAIRLAATYEFPLTAQGYSALVAVGEVKGASVPLIHQRFGGWRAACAAAGVECGVTRIESYESRWTNDDLIAFVI